MKYLNDIQKQRIIKDAYLGKPVAYDDLLAVVISLIDERSEEIIEEIDEN